MFAKVSEFVYFYYQILISKKYMKKLIKQQTKQTIDSVTGEIVDETISKTFYVKSSEEPFILTYVKGLSMIYNIKSAAAIRILCKLLELSNFNSNEVQITAPKRKEIIKELEISEPCFTKSMKLLSDKNIVTGSWGLYYINENIFWRGDSKTREKLLKSAGCKITIEPDNGFE